MSNGATEDGGAPSTILADLARAYGVTVEYWSFAGELVHCTAGAIRAALEALGVDAETDALCAAALADRDEEAWLDVVPPATVMIEGRASELRVNVDDGDEVEVYLHLETGATWKAHQLDKYVPPREIGNRVIGRATFLLQDDLPLGYHLVEAISNGISATGHVIVTPERMTVPENVRAGRPYGFMTQLYSVRSSRSWGLGDYTDLGELCALAKVRAGADFMLINPLHAGEAVPPISPSPYLPSSRRFLFPLYIRVEDIPEVAYLTSQQRAVIEWESEKPRRANATSDLIDRDSVWRAKAEALNQVFDVRLTPGRQAQFAAFRAREGRALIDFATWCAISEAYRGLPWPDDFTGPHTDAVETWRDDNAERVRFYEWLQWISDEQLGRAQLAAKSAGMSLGIMNDLAVGVHPQGADAWALQAVLAEGMGVGAPPDMYNAMGQNWSQPPWNPRALEKAAFLPFRDLVRTAVRHAGALRMDHVLGLFRQWWIPKGNSPSDGAYVYFNHEALVGILVLEAQRAGAVIIGEDLGTLEDWIKDYLTYRGILGTQIAWFDKEPDGHALRPEHYRTAALCSITTHDLPPTAAYLAGEHVRLREELGLLTDVDATWAEAKAERDDMVALLVNLGLVTWEADDEQILIAMHRLILSTPAWLVGIAVTDGVGDRRAQNQPGTDTEYPNWQVPLTDYDGKPVLIDDLFDHPRMRRLVAAVRAAKA